MRWKEFLVVFPLTPSEHLGHWCKYHKKTKQERKEKQHKKCVPGIALFGPFLLSFPASSLYVFFLGKFTRHASSSYVYRECIYNTTRCGGRGSPTKTTRKVTICLSLSLYLHLLKSFLTFLCVLHVAAHTSARKICGPRERC